MSTWTGTLTFEDLGAGVWVLETSKGRHQLAGAIPKELEGKKVVVEGTAEGLFGFGMSSGGKGIKVTKVQAA